MTLTPLICQAADSSQDTGNVLATVGDVKITREMLDHIIGTIPEENRVPFLTPDGRKKILDEVISFTLFAQAAKSMGIQDEPATKTRLAYVQTEYLAREMFRRRLAKAQLVSEDEIRAYYRDHITEFTPPEQIKARHIVVKTEAEARKILERLKGGEDFEKLARSKSIDPAAAQGGRLTMQDGSDWISRGTFETSFEFELFKIPKGEVGGPIKTQFGWHLLKVEDRRQPEARTFIQVRAMIRRRLLEQRNAKLHKQVTEELKKKIPVVIK
jgi:peptidyl-prolyl cis-trans isomerase C